MTPSDKILSHLQLRPYKSSAELCQLVAKKSPTALLSFSGGKDSIVSWLQMRRYFEKIIPVFFYRIPGLSFVDEKISYYENWFGTKIVQLPHPSFIRQLRHGIMQTAENIRTMIKVDLPAMTYDNFFDELKDNRGLPIEIYTGIGNRATDNLQRWTAFVTNGPMNEKRHVFWPVFDYSLDDLEKEIRQAKIQLPIDYKLWGKTFDSIQYRFIIEVKKHYPEDYKKIQHWFPLIDMEILRYEK